MAFLIHVEKQNQVKNAADGIEYYQQFYNTCAWTKLAKLYLSVTFLNRSSK